MRRSITFSVLIGIATVSFVIFLFVFKPAEAQRAANSKFEYAVINGSYSPYPADGPTTVTSAVNICYLQHNGCRNEEVKAEVVIAKFVQDERMENSSSVRSLALERASEVAF
jgi:hypothetical protein